MSSTAELTINGYDARKQWGVIVNTSFTDNMLMPPSVKSPIQSSSRLEHGTRTVLNRDTVKYDKRDVTLEISITATSRSQFLERHQSFVKELVSGWLEITSSLIPGMTFHMRYVSCTQFTNYNGRAAKYILKLEEPDPSNR